LGLVERRDVPPSALFRLVREHVALEALELLADSRRRLLARIGQIAGAGEPKPVSAIVFGSLAGGDGDARSDIDVVVVRPDGTDDDDSWGEAVERWRREIRRASGNVVEVVEVTAAELQTRLERPTGLWSDVERDGIVVFGEHQPSPAGVR
jgi:predicted nucleotidyltransferase